MFTQPVVLRVVSQLALSCLVCVVSGNGVLNLTKVNVTKPDAENLQPAARICSTRSPLVPSHVPHLYKRRRRAFTCANYG